MLHRFECPPCMGTMLIFSVCAAKVSKHARVLKMAPEGPQQAPQYWCLLGFESKENNCRRHTEPTAPDSF